MNNNAETTALVLYVEDDDAVAYLVQHALRQVNSSIELVRLCNGEHGIEFLNRKEIRIVEILEELGKERVPVRRDGLLNAFKN